MFSTKYSERINEEIFKECMALREEGQHVVGTYCAFTPKEIIVAGGGIPVSLCAGSYESAKKSEIDLPRNLCDLIKSSYGHGIADTCPYFHYSEHIIADATCDGKKKMFELLADIKPVHVLYLPNTCSREEDYQYFENEIEKMKAYVESITDTEITDAMINATIKQYNQLRKAMYRLQYLNSEETPLLTGHEMNNIRGAISFECNIPKRVQEIELAIEALEKRREDPVFISTMKNKPRILLTGCPTTHSKLVDIIEEKGAVIVAMENCGGLKTADLVEEDTPSPLKALAKKYLSVACPCITPNTHRLDLLNQLVDDFKVDGVIELTWHACHTYNVEATLVSRTMSKRNTPYLQVTTDYSPGDVGQIATRVEAFLEMI
ncbi:MAG: 2-hydroxyacyl-CoA dehydratase [Clostridia bacterium]|nr:2-hydroxyacyl-CoA dehydratase [Clostridia bacterium]